MADKTKAISSPRITANNDTLEVVPNSVSYTEGFGEFMQRVGSSGGNSTSLVFSENVEGKKTKLKFEVFPTPEQIAIIRQLKDNRNENVFTIETNDFTRTIRQAAICNDYDVDLGADTTISLEIEGMASV